ncbi:hypothetical protein KVT40_006691 [Elsinoe batatas]|uniref:Uncharacterized protein n=1 Tax=Elsinoe batatas TaxID=2601811 RepID=A0A8K0KZX5_9PEZI|nr:hypothetical protein KVT40_006691 [Elsinoe batatas]
MSDIDVALKIHLLSKLTSTPVRSSYVDVTSAPVAISPRAVSCTGISLEHESRLVQHIAFLCSYSDDPTHVMAVAVETHDSPPAAIFVVAANQGRHRQMTDSFQNICGIIGDHARNENRQNNTQRLLQTVIALHQRRILARIRLSWAKSRRASGKMSMLGRLGVAQALLSQTRKASGDTLARARHALEDVRHHCNVLEQQEPQDLLRPVSYPLYLGLLQAIDHLVDDHLEVLDRIPLQPGKWQQSTTDALRRNLRSLARYTKACREILVAARHYQCFQNTSIQMLDGQRQSVRFLDQEAIRSFLGRQEVHKLIERVGSTIPLTPHSFQKTLVSNLQQESRLHAEMQIMMHYDQRVTGPRPFIIASGKQACFLCHTVLTSHPHFRSQGTHGKLYTTWAIPWQGEGATLMHGELRLALSQALELNIERILSTGTKAPAWNPAESAINSIASFTASNISSVAKSYRSQGSVVVASPYADVLSSPSDTKRSEESCYLRLGGLELFFESPTLPTPATEVKVITVDHIRSSTLINLDDADWLGDPKVDGFFSETGIVFRYHGLYYRVRSIS